MDLNYTAAARLLGITTAIFGAFMLFPALTALIYHEYSCLNIFLTAGLIYILAGVIVAYACEPKSHRLMVREGFFIVSCFYLLLAFLGAVPLYTSDTLGNFTDALFESISAVTSTGATLINYPESCFRSIIFLRSLMQWLGSFAILCFSMVVFSNLGLNASELSTYESPVPRLQEITPKLRSIAGFLTFFYTGSTLIEIILLRLGRVGRFDSIIYALSSISNGGFGSRSDSVASLGLETGTATYVQFVLMFFMLLGSLNFMLYFRAFREHPRVLYKDEETRIFLLLTAVTALLIGLDLVLLKGEGRYADGAADMSLLSALFQTVSVITTTGMTSTGFSLWPTFSKLLLLMLMISGSCSLSLGGGIKCARTVLAVKYVDRGIAVRLHPNAVVPIKLTERTVPSDTITAVLNFILLYMATVFIGTLLISLDGASFTASLSSVISCLGNVGPALSSAGHELLYTGASTGARFLLALLMLAGRLEIFAFFMMFAHRFWNPNW